MDRLFLLKNYSIVVFHIVDTNKQEKTIKTAFTTFLRPFFPFGRCLGVDLPRLEEFESIRAVFILTDPLHTGASDSRFKVLLTNPHTASLILPAHKELEGDGIKIDPMKYTEKQFTIKTEIDINQEEDPNFR